VCAKTLEELKVFQSALDAADAVSAILRRDCFRRDQALRDQLSESSSQIPSHIAEGFGQKTDRHFAHYLYIARGSCNEVRSHLTVAKGRGYTTTAECEVLCARYVVIGKRLTNLLKHLRRENRVQRG
jgi:four helix bundle protein